jgi:hypothetical protein
LVLAFVHCASGAIQPIFRFRLTCAHPPSQPTNMEKPGNREVFLTLQILDAALKTSIYFLACVQVKETFQFVLLRKFAC